MFQDFFRDELISTDRPKQNLLAANPEKILSPKLPKAQYVVAKKTSATKKPSVLLSPFNANGHAKKLLPSKILPDNLSLKSNPVACSGTQANGGFIKIHPKDPKPMPLTEHQLEIRSKTMDMLNNTLAQPAIAPVDHDMELDHQTENHKPISNHVQTLKHYLGQLGNDVDFSGVSTGDLIGFQRDLVGVLSGVTEALQKRLS